MLACGITVQVRGVTTSRSVLGLRTGHVPAAYPCPGTRRRQRSGITVFSQRSARSAASSPGRAASRGRSAFMRVTARTVLRSLRWAGWPRCRSLCLPRPWRHPRPARRPTSPLFARFPMWAVRSSHRAAPGADHHRAMPSRFRDPLLHAGAVPGRVRPEPAVQRPGHRPPDHRRREDHRDRGLVRLTDHPERLQTFDAQFGFPNPDLQIEKFGTIPPFDPTNGTMVGWA